MRHVDHRLNGPLEQPRLDFVEEKREEYRRGEREHYAVKGQNQGIYHQWGKTAGFKEVYEVLQPYPRARVKAPEDVVILEPDQDTPHGEVPEKEKVHNAGDAHDVQPVTLAHCFQCFRQLQLKPLFPEFSRYTIIDPVLLEVNEIVKWYYHLTVLLIESKM
jgi:hypothetical protein